MNNKIKIVLGIFIIISVIIIILKVKGEFGTTTSISTPFTYNYNNSLVPSAFISAFEGETANVIGVDPSSNNNTSILSFAQEYIYPFKNGFVAAEDTLWKKISTDLSNNNASSAISTLIESMVADLLKPATAEIDAHYAKGDKLIADTFVTKGQVIKLQNVWTKKPIWFKKQANALVPEYNPPDPILEMFVLL